ncbi:hypothetical protein ANO14919_025950 [Xylariales sp. No.14919]|nr:hypothetical protein ANO14919_025950 [Xylariales sp. No.14919]
MAPAATGAKKQKKKWSKGKGMYLFPGVSGTDDGPFTRARTRNETTSPTMSY